VLSFPKLGCPVRWLSWTIHAQQMQVVKHNLQRCWLSGSAAVLEATPLSADVQDAVCSTVWRRWAAAEAARDAACPVVVVVDLLTAQQLNC